MSSLLGRQRGFMIWLWQKKNLNQNQKRKHTFRWLLIYLVYLFSPTNTLH